MKEITTRRNGGPGLVFLRAGFSHSVSYVAATHTPPRLKAGMLKGRVDFSTSRQLSAARLHLPPGQQKY